MVFRKIGPMIDFEAMEAWERRKKCSIPQPYRVLLRQLNGGKPDHRMFKFRRRDGRWARKAFDGFAGTAGKHGLGYLLRTFVARKRIPADLFPIGSAEGGSLLLMGGPGPRFGKVYFWDHELAAPEGAPPTEDNVYFVADSVEEFINELKPLLVVV